MSFAGGRRWIPKGLGLERLRNVNPVVAVASACCFDAFQKEESPRTRRLVPILLVLGASPSGSRDWILMNPPAHPRGQRERRRACRASPALVSPPDPPIRGAPSTNESPGGETHPPTRKLMRRFARRAWGPWGRRAAPRTPGPPFGHALRRSHPLAAPVRPPGAPPYGGGDVCVAGPHRACTDVLVMVLFDESKRVAGRRCVG